MFVWETVAVTHVIHFITCLTDEGGVLVLSLAVFC